VKVADTNLIVRTIVRDNLVQAAIAEAVVEAGILLPVTILMETEWVLRSRYRLPRAEIARTLTALLDSETVTTPDEAAIRWALTRYAAGADLADMLHLTQSRRADAFLTFDQALAAGPASAAPVAIEVAA
jgi:predicted nucleic-acid-binding protein